MLFGIRACQVLFQRCSAQIPVDISIHLHTTLQQETDAGILRKLTLTIPASCSLYDLLARLGMEIDMENTLFVVNGRTVEMDYILMQDDQVHLIPAISGGHNLGN